MSKLYCYADETGQDTKGMLFSVCCTVTITEESRDALEQCVLNIEIQSKKKGKWQKTDKIIRNNFLDALIGHAHELKEKIYIQHWSGVQDYSHATAETISRAIQYANQTLPAIIYIDGLSRHERKITAVRLRRFGVKTEKVKGLKDEQSALIRLCDAMAGFVRDYLEGQDYAKPYFKELLTRNVIIEI